MRSRRVFVQGSAAALLAACSGETPARGDAVDLLNVSYDPTREFYAEINPAFARFWRNEPAHGPVRIAMSHGGSSAQAQAVVDGLAAQVVTLATPLDIDTIAAAGLVDANWRARLPNNSAPYTSCIVFVVRAGNVKRISNWGDLIRPGVRVVTPDPKTSGGGRWVYLAAWAFATRAYGAARARDFIARLYANAETLDAGARAATERFTGGEGDVLLAWENEAHLIQSNALQIIAPSISIRAEPAVTIVDRTLADQTTRETAMAYLEFLYTLQAQETAARHYYRPFDQSVLAANADRFPQIPLVTVDAEFGSWADAYGLHFADGGVFDQVRTAP